jgi:hypothetical protein
MFRPFLGSAPFGSRQCNCQCHYCRYQFMSQSWAQRQSQGIGGLFNLSQNKKHVPTIEELELRRMRLSERIKAFEVKFHNSPTCEKVMG